MSAKFDYISLFTGIGGFDLGFERAGMKCKAMVEIDDDARHVLDINFPDVPKYKDIREFDCEKYTRGTIDVVCGGFPCQDVSVAGRRVGLGGSRTGLWYEFHRVICEIRPRWVVAENVTGLLTNNSGRDFGEILRCLSESGYDAEWDCLPASTFGAPHERDRVFIVAYPIGKRLPGYVFKEGIRSAAQKASTEFGDENVDCGSWWAENSANIRVGDGVPLRVARKVTKQAGNAVAPQITEWIGRRIMELDVQP